MDRLYSMLFAIARGIRAIWPGTAEKVVPATLPIDSGPPQEQSEDLSPAWCLIGNVVDQHVYGEAKEIRRGSKQFTPGTKVYCLPAQWGDGYEQIVAIGIARGSRRLITVVTKASHITHWRAKVVYKPAVLRRLKKGFDEFDRQWESQDEVEAWVKILNARGQPPLR